MLIRYGNLLKTNHQYICFTTNGFVTKTGNAVCGRGIALAMQKKFGDLKSTLGSLITNEGNKVQIVFDNYIAYPVKPNVMIMAHPNDVVRHARHLYKVGDTVPGYHCKANYNIIERSAYELVELADKEDLHDIALPRPGCGAGELSWERVYDRISPILDHRFTVYTFKPESNKRCLVTGGKTLETLSNEMINILIRLITQDITIVVGDNPGVDTIVQTFLKERGYDRVVVYFKDTIKHNIGYRTLSPKTKNKVVFMETWVHDVHYALILNDGSDYTRAIINELAKQGKYTRTLKV